MSGLMRYRVALRGQRYLDMHILDERTEQYLTLDTGDGPWIKPPKVESSARVVGVAYQHVRTEDLVALREYLSKSWGLGFQVYQPRGSILYACRAPTASVVVDPVDPLVRVGDVVIVGFSDRIPVWNTLTGRVNGARVVLGTLGFDRYVAMLANVAANALNMAHAWCLADTDPRRPPSAEAFRYGQHTTTTTGMVGAARWTQVCYVPKDAFYADCRVLPGTATNAWVHLRLIRNSLDDESHNLPFSMQLRHPHFTDSLVALQGQAEIARMLLKFVQNAEIVQVLRFIRIRNQINSGQPRWDSVSGRASADAWDKIWAFQLAERIANGIVVLLARGVLVLYMAKEQMDKK